MEQENRRRCSAALSEGIADHQQGTNTAAEDSNTSLVEVTLPDGTKAGGSFARTGSGALGLPKIPSIILTPHHSLSLLNEEIAEEQEDDERVRGGAESNGLSEDTFATRHCCVRTIVHGGIFFLIKFNSSAGNVKSRRLLFRSVT